MHIYDWFTEIVDKTYTGRRFKKTQEEDDLLAEIYNTIEFDKNFNRTKAELWLKYGVLPHNRKGLALQDFYPTNEQIEQVKGMQDVLVFTREEHRQKCLAFRSPFENALATEVEQLREQLARIDHNEQLHRAFKEIIDLKFKNSELLTQMDKMAKQIQDRDDAIERLKLKIPNNGFSFVDESGIDHADHYTRPNDIGGIITATAERMGV